MRWIGRNELGCAANERAKRTRKHRPAKLENGTSELQSSLQTFTRKPNHELILTAATANSIYESEEHSGKSQIMMASFRAFNTTPLLLAPVQSHVQRVVWLSQSRRVCPPPAPRSRSLAWWAAATQIKTTAQRGKLCCERDLGGCAKEARPSGCSCGQQR